MDLVRPDRGRAALLGLDSRRDSLAIKRRVGYLPGELVQFPGVTTAYLIGLLAGLRGGVDPTRITALAERFDLDLGRRCEIGPNWVASMASVSPLVWQRLLATLLAVAAITAASSGWLVRPARPAPTSTRWA